MLTIFAISWWFQSFNLFRSVSTCFVANFDEKMGFPEKKTQKRCLSPQLRSKEIQERTRITLAIKNEYLMKKNHQNIYVHIYIYICIVVLLSNPPKKTRHFPKDLPGSFRSSSCQTKKISDEKPDRSKVLISSCNSSCKAMACKSSSESLGSSTNG